MIVLCASLYLSLALLLQYGAFSICIIKYNVSIYY